MCLGLRKRYVFPKVCLMDSLNDCGLLASHEWLQDEVDAGQDPSALKLLLKDRIEDTLTGYESCFSVETAKALSLDFFQPKTVFNLTPPYVMEETEFGRLRTLWFTLLEAEQEFKLLEEGENSQCLC